MLLRSKFRRLTRRLRPATGMGRPTGSPASHPPRRLAQQAVRRAGAAAFDRAGLGHRGRRQHRHGAGHASSHFEETDAAYIDGHVITLSPQVSALVKAVPVDDNQMVHKGDVIVQLDPTDYQVALDQARANQAAMEGEAAAGPERH